MQLPSWASVSPFVKRALDPLGSFQLQRSLLPMPATSPGYPQPDCPPPWGLLSWGLPSRGKALRRIPREQLGSICFSSWVLTAHSCVCEPGACRGCYTLYIYILASLLCKVPLRCFLHQGTKMEINPLWTDQQPLFGGLVIADVCLFDLLKKI